MASLFRTALQGSRAGLAASAARSATPARTFTMAPVATKSALAVPTTTNPDSSMLPGSIDNGADFVMTKVDDLVNYVRKGSIWPMTFGLA